MISKKISSTMLRLPVSLILGHSLSLTFAIPVILHFNIGLKCDLIRHYAYVYSMMGVGPMFILGKLLNSIEDKCILERSSQTAFLTWGIFFSCMVFIYLRNRHAFSEKNDRALRIFIIGILIVGAVFASTNCFLNSYRSRMCPPDAIIYGEAVSLSIPMSVMAVFLFCFFAQEK